MTLIIPSAFTLDNSMLDMVQLDGNAVVRIPSTPYARVIVAGTAYLQTKGSVKITDIVEERSTASVSIPDGSGAYTFYRGQPIQIYIAGNLEFGGIIDTPSRDMISPEGVITHSFQCADWHYLADKRFAAATYANRTCGYIVQDLVTNVLAAEGVTVGSITAGPIVPLANLSWVSVSSCLDALAKLANCIWWIDAYKNLYFVPRVTYPAPWAVTTADIKKGSAHWSGANPNYRNVQYIRGASAVTTQQTESRLGDGQNTAFTMSYPLNGAPTITVGGIGKTNGTKGVDTGKDFYYSVGDAVIAAAVAPGAGVTVSVTYKGQYSILIKSADLGQVALEQSIEQGGTGIVESILDDPTVTDMNSAYASAAAQLSEYGQTSDQITFTTVKPGLAKGQLVTITHTPLQIVNESFLISQVDTTALGSYIEYKITAVRGSLLGSWAKFLATLVTPPQSNILNLGTQAVLNLQTTPADFMHVTESVTETIHACSVPSTVLYPSTTLYPC
jgi:hypothetical protein